MKTVPVQCTVLYRQEMNALLPYNARGQVTTVYPLRLVYRKCNYKNKVRLERSINFKFWIWVFGVLTVS